MFGNNSNNNHDSSSNNNNNPLKLFLKDCVLDGTNFIEWELKLRIALRYEHKLYTIEEALPETPATNANRAIRDAFDKRIRETDEVACVMLATMTTELQKQFGHLSAFDIMSQLKEMFQQQPRQERFECVKALFGCRMQEGGKCKYTCA